MTKHKHVKNLDTHQFMMQRKELMVNVPLFASMDNFPSDVDFWTVLFLSFMLL